MNLNDTLTQFLKKHEISGAIVVGVSGGLDSMVLLNLLHQEHKNVHACHVNYKTRGADSDADEEFVRSYCRKHDIPFHFKIADQSEAGGNFQDWARRQRYNFFESVRQKQHANCIAVAHHRDDQAETILMNILKGRSPTGWHGMQEVSDNIIRPFLQTSKKELRSYADKNHIPWREDASNESNTYARNALRNMLGDDKSPLFPGWQQNVLQLSAFSEQFDFFMDAAIKKHVRKNQISGDWLNELSDDQVATIIRRVLDLEFGAGYLFSRGLASELTKIRNLQPGSSLMLGDGFEIFRDRSTYLLRKKSKDVKPLPEVSLNIGDVPVDISGLRLKSGRFEKPLKDELHINKTVLGNAFKVRNWRDGDRIRPLGMKGRQKVSDLLTNQKVASSKKKLARVLVAFDDNICAVIFPHSENLNKTGIISDEARCHPGDDALVIKRIT